ncbi:mechanosensitive channel MscK [Azomonas macrocytogenes]|uniref:Potassium efflux system protein n=1 Tax=Azomonas macrocytogenes TaxID=69962 RepID=A0A839T0J7_AZOMA|nr:mechanosensitive channel MscK [Azomonas macrocytogenes]MBB3102922.1 potassium efflux system protein [Azomonas macrocytogenes]
MPSLRNVLLAILIALTTLPQLIQAAPNTAAQPAPASETSLADQTKALLDQAKSRQQSLAELKEQLAAAPQQTRTAERELARLRATAALDPSKAFANLSVPELEQRLADRVRDLSGWQKAISDANSMVIAAQTRPERAQAEISTKQARTLEIEGILNSNKENGQPLAPERIANLKAEQDALRATIDLRRQELTGNTQMLNLGKARRDLLNEQVNRAQQETLALQTQLNNRRREQSEQTVAEISRSSASEDLTSNTILTKASSENLELSNYLLRGTERLNELTQQNLQTQQQLDYLNQADRSLEEQISVLSSSQVLSKILIQQQQALPQIEVDPNLTNYIADLRLYQFDLSQRMEKNSDPQAYIGQLLQGQPDGTDTPELRQGLLDLLQSRGDLLRQLEQVLNSLLSEAVTLQVNQKQLQDTAQTISKTINEQMFWIPSNKPLTLSWFKTLPEQLQAQLDSIPWKDVMTQLGAGLVQQPLFFLPLLVLIAAMLWKRKAIGDQLDTMGKSIGHYHKDSQLHTPLALLLNILLALPGAMALALCGFALEMDGRGQNVSLSAAFFQMAQAWLVFYTAYQILSPARMAEVHFRWAPKQVAFLRREVGRLGIIVMIMVAVVTFAMHQPAGLDNDVLGIITVLVCYLLICLGLVRILLKGPNSDNAPLPRQALGLLFSMLPLALALTVGLGYYYTALRLTGRLTDTLYLLLVWILIEAMLVRSLSVAARRLAYKRMMDRRKKLAEEGQDQSEIKIEEPAINIEQLNQQSLRLMRITLFGLFFVMLYWVWSDVISVVSYLDNFILYQAGSGANMTSISLKDVLSALLIGGISIVLARNLPSLFEVFILSRLKLTQGSAYATSTLLTYILIALGITSTLSAVGVRWDQLQWLVAALSVGLGFGLQEIFANFVSGLIILFERPVRIGDLVTINNLTGTVTKIRIRATTITDADRKEIIVPNKAFITSQLLNWTLSDTVTRVTMQIGVAYNSDLALVRKLILQVAKDNSRVMNDPAPSVAFINFGEYAVIHELRLLVRELGDRQAVVDEISAAIDRQFSEHGILLAARQTNITLTNGTGHQMELTSESAEPEKGPTAIPPQAPTQAPKLP